MLKLLHGNNFNKREDVVIMRKEFREENLEKWQKAILEIFPNGIPEKCEWSNNEEIVKVFNIIGKANLNHTFYPTGGGFDLCGAEPSFERDCINLLDGGTLIVVKPEKLIFNSFKDDKSNIWSYFRLETHNLEPSGIYDDRTSEYGSEELVCINKSQYISRDYWDNGLYYDANGNERKFTRKDTIATRYFRGAFVIFAKGSIYNKMSYPFDAYDGRHNKMNNETFRQYIEKLFNRLKN